MACSQADGIAMKDRNIEYKIIGRVDGSWTIQAFDREDKPITGTMVVSTVNAALEMWMFLNGYSNTPPDPDDELTEDIYVEKAS